MILQFLCDRLDLLICACLFLPLQGKDQGKPSSYSLSGQQIIKGEVYSERTYSVHIPGAGSFQGPIHESGMVFLNRIRPEFGGVPGIPLGSAVPQNVFEFRCHRLIPGELMNCQFVPQAGARIISMEEYVISGRNERIYNLPGVLVRNKEAVAKAGPMKSDPPETPEPQKAKAQPSDFTFQQDLSPKFFLKIGAVTFFGTLNQYGDFVPDPKHEIVHTKFAAEQIGEWLIREDDDGDVFEFRSGRLIPGKLKAGYFRPEVGKKVIPFEDYRYSEKGIQIYNLPGKFVKKPKKP